MQEFKSYNAADFQRYLTGVMTPLEMHALEKAALDDEFLAEALEGYARLNEEERVIAIAELEKLNFKTSQPAPIVSIQRPSSKRMVLRVAAAVAVIALLSITGIWISKSSSNQKDTALASKEEAAVTADSSSQPAPSSAVPLTDSIAMNPVQHPARESQTAPTAESVLPQAYPNNTDAVKDRAILAADSAAFVYKADTKVPGNVTQPVSAGSTDDVAEYSKKEIITPTQTQKLEEVTISNNAVASNNNNGYYKQSNNAPASIPSNRAENEISIEKFETRKKALTAATSKVAASQVLASPSIGWDSYHQYIKNKIHSDTATRVCSGYTTLVQFKVKKSGKIHAVSVLSSFGNSFCDRFAIQLLKEGPAWIPGTDPQQIQQLKVSY